MTFQPNITSDFGSLTFGYLLHFILVLFYLIFLKGRGVPANLTLHMDRIKYARPQASTVLTSQQPPAPRVGTHRLGTYRPQDKTCMGCEIPETQCSWTHRSGTHRHVTARGSKRN
jgi:hypothetical protein